jgi:hypothetical protein
MESRPETAERGWAHAARAVVSPHTVSEKSRSFLALTLVIGALTGLAVVAFIVVDRTPRHAPLSDGQRAVAAFFLVLCSAPWRWATSSNRYFPQRS